MNIQKRSLPQRMLISDVRGVTYLLTMMAIVLIGISVTVVGKQWKTMIQREQEADLIAHGIEIQRAIAAYSAANKAPAIPGERYPLTLEQLTKVNPNTITKIPQRFLRKVYKDPITRGDWDYIPGESGGIKGVRSKSKLTTLKQHDFPVAVRHFEGLTHYNEWIFQHPNSSSAESQVPVPGSQTQPGIGPQGQPGMGPQGQPGMGPQGQPGIGLQGQPGIGPQSQPGSSPLTPSGGAPFIPGSGSSGSSGFPSGSTGFPPGGPPGFPPGGAPGFPGGPSGFPPPPPAVP
jgi:type II secretory pathway pseudopilin PulG